MLFWGYALWCDNTSGEGLSRETKTRETYTKQRSRESIKKGNRQVADDTGKYLLAH
jgi:hypothetical protein